MDFDDDSSAAPVAKPASKFQPRAKPRPRAKKDSSSSNTVKETVKQHVPVKSSNPESAVTSQSNETKLADSAMTSQSNETKLADSAMTSQSNETKLADSAMPMETSEALNSQTSLPVNEPLVVTDESHSRTGLQSSEVVPGGSPGLGHYSEKSAETVFCSKDASLKLGSDGDNLGQSKNLAVGEGCKEALIPSNTENQSDQWGVIKGVLEDLSLAGGDGDIPDPYTDCLLNQDDLLEPAHGVSPDFRNSSDPATDFSMDQQDDLQESNQMIVSAPERIYSKDIPGTLELEDQSGNAPGPNAIENVYTPCASYDPESVNFHELHTEQYAASQSDCLPNITANGNEGSSAEAPNQLLNDGQDNPGTSNNGKGKVSRKKRSSRKSKKDNAGNATTVRKRIAKRLNVDMFPKTERKKRTVDKSLLEKPDDDIDFQRLPIKDLIMLAEYRERQNKRPVATAVTTPPLYSTSTSAHNVRQEYDDFWEGEGGDLPSFEDDLDGINQEGTTFDNPSSSGVQISTENFNYHSHMHKKLKRVTWSKQDTELFYEGVRQFGSDLSMIAELFPDMDRKHIKNKYKKEERKQPMRLHDALTTRAKDFTQYERVIKNMQEKIDKDERAQQSDEEADEEQAAEEEDLGGEVGHDENREETHAEIHAKAAKFEQKDEEGVADVEDPKTEVRELKSPDVVSEEDDDMDDFSQYKSML